MKVKKNIDKSDQLHCCGRSLLGFDEHHPTDLSAWRDLPDIGILSERNMIKIISDSGDALVVLEEDPIISSMCDIELLTYTRFSQYIPDDSLSGLIYFVLLTDEKSFNSGILNNLVDFQQYTNDVLLISSHIVNEMPCFCLSAIQDIYLMLREFCLLIKLDKTIHIDFRDIKTVLLTSGGEIKFLQKQVKTNMDFAIFWDELSALINGKICDIIFNLTFPKESEMPLGPIVSNFFNGLQLIENSSQKTSCLYSQCFWEGIAPDTISVASFIRINS